MTYYPTDTIKGVKVPKTTLGMQKMLILCNAAEKLFAEKSFYATSISDICKEAHAAVGTFYIYFDSKKALYAYLVECYKQKIKMLLAQNIANCKTRYDKEMEGIKTFVKFAVDNPNVYNIIWGSLSVEEEIFVNYYVSFAESYSKSLSRDGNELSQKDCVSLAYSLMGITNFVGLRAIFENMTDEEIDQTVEGSIMGLLKDGMFN